MSESVLVKIARAQSYLSGVTVSSCLQNIKKGLSAVFVKEMAQMWKRNLAYEDEIGLSFEQNAAQEAVF